MLSLYRVAEDAWAGGLDGWCEAARARQGESWILTGNAGQARWIARKLGGGGMEAVRVLDADGLRAELARVAGVEPPGKGSAAAEFVVKTATGRAGHEARALLQAAEELARAGWHLNKLEIDETEARRLQRVLGDGGLAPGFFERLIRDRVPAKVAHICCVGWDAGYWREIGLLDLAARSAESLQMYVPAPRLPADAQQREWIETLEQRYGLERQVCAESGFESQNDVLAARLEKSGLAGGGEVKAPVLLVGHEWADEVGLVCETVMGWLKEGEEAAPIGIVGPEDSATALAVAAELAKRNVRVECAGRMRELEPGKLIAEQIARYHLNDRDVMEFAELARLLWQHGGKRWKVLEPEATQDALDRAFCMAQSRNSRILVRAQPWRKDGLWGGVGELADVLGRWDAEEVAWSVARRKWLALCESLEIPADAGWLGLLDGVLADEKMGERGFMELVLEAAAEERRRVELPDYKASAPVVVTSFAEAGQQSWGRLIFLDSSEGGWPAAQQENRFLPDAMRARLNANRKEAGRLPTAWERRLIADARFLELLEHCRGEFAFAGALLEKTESGGPTQPNEWVLRTLLESAPGKAPGGIWTASARVCEKEEPELDPAERKHLENVHSARRNGTMPIDRYQFNFSEMADDLHLNAVTWAATDLEMAVKSPATFALKVIFGVEQSVWWNPVRTEAAAVGNRVHRWLGRALGKGLEFAPAPANRDAERRLWQEAAASRRELVEWFAAEELPLPLWWHGCLRRAEWAARRCLREVGGALENGVCAVEQEVKVAVQTALGTVPLKGRMDLVLSDQAELRGASVQIFDFKTGRSETPTIKSLVRGEGWQFAAYYLMARDAGAAEAVIGIVRPEDRVREVFSKSDEAELRVLFGRFAEMRRTLRFGRRGPLVSEHGAVETLPMATTPIDKAVLEQKSALYLLAS